MSRRNFHRVEPTTRRPSWSELGNGKLNFESSRIDLRRWVNRFQPCFLYALIFYVTSPCSVCSREITEAIWVGALRLHWCTWKAPLTKLRLMFSSCVCFVCPGLMQYSTWCHLMSDQSKCFIPCNGRVPFICSTMSSERLKLISSFCIKSEAKPYRQLSPTEPSLKPEAVCSDEPAELSTAAALPLISSRQFNIFEFFVSGWRLTSLYLHFTLKTLIGLVC